jgi:branched-subunit amino acid aminotransferase/4-amino-4-deoxychorismate lyase
MPVINNPAPELKEIITSPAFRYGQGFFSTTRIINYLPLWLEDHISRLSKSLADFAMGGFDKTALAAYAGRWPQENHIENGFMRITCWVQAGEVKLFIDGGKLNGSHDLRGLTVASHHRHSSQPLLKYKSFNYWPNNIAYHNAINRGYYDAVFLNEKGEIAETTRCNLFWSHAGKLYTPELNCGLLPGIARNKVLYLADQLGMEVIQGNFPLRQLEQAEEVFLTNSVRGIVGISHFGHQHFYNCPGPVTTKLIQAYRSLIEEYLNLPPACL